MGNAKSVDIYVSVEGWKTIIVDAKAGRNKHNFPIDRDSVKRDIFYIFVNLLTENRIANSQPPEYFIAKGGEILSKSLVGKWGTREGIERRILNSEAYKNRWDKLPLPPNESWLFTKYSLN